MTEKLSAAADGPRTMLPDGTPLGEATRADLLWAAAFERAEVLESIAEGRTLEAAAANLEAEAARLDFQKARQEADRLNLVRPRNRKPG